jgi:hypothetical protein
MPLQIKQKKAKLHSQSGLKNTQKRKSATHQAQPPHWALPWVAL